MPALYLYEQAGEASSWLQRGIISLVRLGSPEAAGILPHESVMPGLVAGRRDADGGDAGQPGADLPHLRRRAAPAPACDAGHGHRDHRHVAAERAPLVSITTEDGVTHRLWRLGDPGEQAAIVADLAGRRALIADGHHRYAAYLDLQAEKRASGLGAGPWDYGLAFLVDSDAYPPRLGADPPGAAGPAAGARG